MSKSRASYCGQCDTSEPWCGRCYEVRRCRRPKRSPRLSNEVRPLSRFNQIRVEPEESLQSKQPIATVTKAADHWRDSLPLLWGHLTQGRSPDGAHRLTSTLLLFMEAGRIKLALHDRAEARIAFLSVSGLPEGFIELEAALRSERLEWRRKRPSP